MSRGLCFTKRKFSVSTWFTDNIVSGFEPNKKILWSRNHCIPQNDDWQQAVYFRCSYLLLLKFYFKSSKEVIWRRTKLPSFPVLPFHLTIKALPEKVVSESSQDLRLWTWSRTSSLWLLKLPWKVKGKVWTTKYLPLKLLLLLKNQN